MTILNYNIKIIKHKINLLEHAIASPNYTLIEKASYINRIEDLKRDYYIALIQSDLE
jgi:hypothetical protein